MYPEIQKIEIEISDKDTKDGKTYVLCKRIITNIEGAMGGYIHIEN